MRSLEGRSLLSPELEAIADRIRHCPRCRLAKTRKNAVPGRGDHHAKVVLVGEAPGVEEDKTGLPFVGRAGDVLDELLPEAGLTRERDAFITNIVRCRPPDYRNPEKNRKPEEDEIGFCRSYLCDQLKEIRPTVVVAMGESAAQAILSTTESITSIRGNPKWWGPYIVLPTFHPAYPLRGGGGGAMEDLREDFRTIPRLLTRELVPEPEARAEFWCSEGFTAVRGV